MCGICGRLNWGRPGTADVELLRTMNAQLTHRGPDDDGFFSGDLSGSGPLSGSIGLAMRRLAIIDVAGGQQPMENETGEVVVVFNGEIYNFQELRSELAAAGHQFKTHSDTEVIVHGYEVWGDAVAQKLNGMFAFALWDKRRNRLLIARDHMGIKPVYYAVLGDRLVFGSEIKSLLADPAVPRDIDPLAIDDYLSLRYIPAPRSIYQAIRKLEPASLLVWEGGRVVITKYWAYDPPEAEDRGLDYYLEKADALIADAVKRQLVSEVPLGTFLSGGLDSPTIAWHAKKFKPDLMTFTMYFSDRAHSERAEAALVARHLGTDHFEQEVTPEVEGIVPTLVDIFDEPFGDDSMIPTYFLTKMARQRMTVALSGDGGDELFGGYRTYVADRFAPLYRALPEALRSDILEPLMNGPLARVASQRAPALLAFMRSAGRKSPLEHFGWTELFREDVKGRLKSPLLTEAARGHSASESFERAWASAGRRRGLERFLYVDQQTHLPDEFLVKIDRLSMAHSLEVRPPFLDVRLVEFAAEIPEIYKLKGWTTKWLIRRLMKGRLPESTLAGTKRGFGSPMANWMSGPLLKFARQRFAPSRVRENPFVNPEEPMRLLDAFLSGKRELARRLWSLLVLLEWYERKGRG